ncbi:MAG: SusC/RagA family TonB-linked outer membrane protein [Chitinophagaceae bacterium]|jgi:iron complex outermembrane receptor protein|nr:SusC/RagA family TonB-linked outer membrane protein [Chitinophagaceae bacterium]
MKCNRLSFLALCAFLLLIGSNVVAQRTISGVVFSSQQNVPLSNVSVQIPGTNRGTVTTPSGSYSLSVPDGAKSLTFSYIGYLTQTIDLSNRNEKTINVTLYPDSANNLGDVVIIGYGAVRKQDVAGSVSTINSKDFQTGAITSFDQAIQGKVAGVQISPAGAHPGQSNSIYIRGISTLSGNTGPLVVVDGIPYGQYVNPDDIESVTVLKDAASTAIYGSQGTNGVILITTKKGRPGAVKFNFNTQFAEQTVAKTVDVLNAAQYNALATQNPGGVFTGYEQLLGSANTDWQKLIYHTAPMSNSNLSFSGAIGKWLPFRVSVGFLAQNGILMTDNMKRGTGSISLTPAFLQNHLKVELNLQGSMTWQWNANTGAIGSAVRADPTQSVYDPSDTKFGGYFEWIANGIPNSNAYANPVGMLNQSTNYDNYNRGSGNLKLDYSLQFLPELHIMANWGFDVAGTSGYVSQAQTARTAFTQYVAPSGDTLIYLGQHQQKTGNDDNHNRNYFAEYSLQYNKDFPSIKSHINAMGMYAFYSWQNTQYNYPNFAYLNNVLDTVPNSVPQYPYSFFKNTLVSYIGRLVYTFNEKYVLTGSVRSDGSSKLAPDSRWVTFGSVAFAWNIAGENFLKNSNVVSALKLRASYGKTANQGGIGDYGFYQGFYLTNAQSQYLMGNQYYQRYMPTTYNSGLTWETTTSPDFGLDFGFLHNRISGSIDWYDKHTKNLLVSTVLIPAGTNFSNTLPGANIGTMTSKGVELNLNFIPVKTKDVTWNVNLNISHNKSTITSLYGGADTSMVQAGNAISGGTGSYINYMRVGQTPYAFRVYHQLYNPSGTPIEGAYLDVNGDGIINPSDLYFYHSPYPDWILGFGTSVTWKRWTVSTVLRANIGNYAYNNDESSKGVVSAMATNGYLANANTDVLKTGFVNWQILSDYYVQNASFLKMDNLGLTYYAGYLDRAKKVNLSVSANVQNVFTVTKYTGVNPDLTYTNGVDNSVYPLSRTYTLGLNLNF